MQRVLATVCSPLALRPCPSQFCSVLLWKLVPLDLAYVRRRLLEPVVQWVHLALPSVELAVLRFHLCVLSSREEALPPLWGIVVCLRVERLLAPSVG